MGWIRVMRGMTAHSETLLLENQIASTASQEKCISAVDEDKIALKFAFHGEYLK